MILRIPLLLVLLPPFLPTGLTSEPGKAVDLLQQAARLEKERAELEKQLQALTPQLEKKMTSYLPKLTGKLAGYTWGTLRYGSGRFNVDLVEKKDSSQRVLTLQIRDCRHQLARWKNNYSKQKRQGYPAREFKDRSLSLLVGNLELRAIADAQHPAFQSTEALEELLKAFDLKTLAGL
jgi:hypothetical protein